jgi:hypothetical protein
MAAQPRLHIDWADRPGGKQRYRQADPRPLGDEVMEGSRADERAVAAGVRLFRSAVDASRSAPQRDDAADGRSCRTKQSQGVNRR